MLISNISTYHHDLVANPASPTHLNPNHLSSSHGALDVQDDGVTEVADACHCRWLLHLRGPGLLHQRCQSCQSLLLLGQSAAFHFGVRVNNQRDELNNRAATLRKAVETH